MIATLLLASTISVSSADSLALLPSETTLQGQNATQQLILTRRTPQLGSKGDLTPEAAFTSSSPGVARVDAQGVVRAVADGETRITAQLPDGRQATTRIRVESAGQPPTRDFRNQVRSVMTKTGCNSGPCHGAGAGQNFFKLSLRGYSPEADYRALTREAGGRRISRQEPSRSLLLLKPTLAVSHGGGRLLETDSLDYRILADWIAGGARGPSPEDPRIERLEVFPSQATLRPGDQHRLVVRAFFSDGRTEDVSRWGKYASSDASVAKVGEDGRVEISGHGEAILSVWYLDRIASARIAVPFPGEIPEEVFRNATRQNFVDDPVLEKLKRMRIPPSELCTDSEFLRRAHLDAAGILPSVEEAERVCGRSGSPKTKPAGRFAAGAVRVRGSLGLQMVRPPPSFQLQAHACGHSDLPRLDPAERGREQTLGPLRPRDHHRFRKQSEQRRRQLLSAARRAHRAGGET